MPYKNHEEKLAYDKWYRENVLTKEEVQKYNHEYGIKNYAKIALHQKSYVKENREKVLAQKSQYAKSKKKEIKKLFVDMYGGKCACCGETILEFLTLDHIHGRNGFGKTEKEARGLPSYRRAIREYKPDFYRILCYNCNSSNGHYGYCPHQRN